MAEDRPTTRFSKDASVPVSWLLGFAGLALGGGGATVAGANTISSQLAEVRVELRQCSQQIREQGERLRGLEAATGDRWTRSNHEAFSRDLRDELRQIDARLRILEKVTPR